MKILQLTAHFSPNVGGVETHLDDLVSALVVRKEKVFVLTYRPLTTKARWKIYEKSLNLEILRLPWLPGFFYRLVRLPALEFFYLIPGLFTATPFILLIKRPDVIHSHGLVAGFVAVFWGKVFRKRVIITTHSIYHFPKQGLYRNLVKMLFQNADYVLTLSKQSQKEITSLGIQKKKVKVFTYWINLKKFKRMVGAKKKLGWRGLSILFVGRLVAEKGIRELLEAAQKWNKQINLIVVGAGPLASEVEKNAKKSKNLTYFGRISQENLAPFYSAADLLVVPSVHEEGFGRVILESLACGTPVLGAKRGAIPEAVDTSVAKLISISPKNLTEAIDFFYQKPQELRKLARKARKFAVRKYSEKNVETIIKTYSD